MPVWIGFLHQGRFEVGALDIDAQTGAILDGPLALDNAISKEAARIKKIESVVACDPDIVGVPDLAAGNILAKQLTFMSNADGCLLYTSRCV